MAVSLTRYTSDDCGNTTSDSMTGPVVDGSNPVMVFVVVVNCSSAPEITATYDGVSLGTPVVDGNYYDYVGITVFVLVNPGSQKTFAWVNTGGTGYTVAGAFLFNGVDQSTPYRTATESGFTYVEDPDKLMSADVTNSQSGDLIFEMFGANDESTNMHEADMGAGQTYVCTIDSLTGGYQVISSYCTEPGASGTVTASWSKHTTGGWVFAGLPLIPASASLPGVTITPWTTLYEGP